MPYDPQTHHRRSIRLKGYDYTQAGAYFVTIVTQDRACLFGEVSGGEMRLNERGQMVLQVWEALPLFYLGVQTDAFVVMPNHIHGIIILTDHPVGAGPRACPEEVAGPRACPEEVAGPRACPEEVAGPRACPEEVAGPRACPETEQPQTQQPQTGQPRGVAPTLSLADVVHRFKTLTTKRYADGVKTLGWPPFRGRLWQRNYYEHIVRNESDLKRIRSYIATNPLRWERDHENPLTKGSR